MSSTIRAHASSPRILSIQAFRGIAAMLVVFLHLHHVEGKYFSANTLGAFQYGWIGVDLFFLISGVVISLVTVGKFQDRANAFRFLYHRLARIYPIYWFYYLIIFAAYLYNPLWISAATGHHLDLLPSIFLIPCSSMVVGQAWTLSYELYFYIIFFFILFLIPERFVIHTLLGWGAVVALIDCFLRVPYTAHTLWVMTDTFLFEFLAGCLLFRFFHRFTLPSRAGGWLLFLSLVWFGAYVVYTNYAHAGDAQWLKNSYWIRPLCAGVTGFLFLLGAMTMERAGTLRIGGALSHLGDWSYSIYLSHEIVIELVGRTAARFLHSVRYAAVLVDILALPLVILVGYCSYNWVELPILARLYKRTSR